MDSDRQISSVDLAVRGDAKALDQLFAPCIPRLQRVAVRLLCNEQDSEDALQEGLLSAFRHLNQFRSRAQFTTWVRAIVVNAAKSQLRRRRARPSISSLDEPLHEHEGLCAADMVADPRSHLDEHYARTERHRILVEAIQRLPPIWRAVIQLYDIEGLQMREIAARLGLSISAVKSRHRRANHRILETVNDVSTRHHADHERPRLKPTAKALAASPQPGSSPKVCAPPRRQRFVGSLTSSSLKQPKSRFRDFFSGQDSQQIRSEVSLAEPNPCVRLRSNHCGL